MAYDLTKVPAGFQDLIPNNDQNEQQNAQNIADTAQNVANNAQNIPVAAQPQQDDFYLDVFGGARAAEENKAELAKYAEIEAPKEADKIKKGNIYRKYFATQPEVLAQAKEMAGRLQIPVEAITRSSEDYDAAVKIDNRYKKLLSISPTGEKQFTLDELYAEYPELLKLKTDTDGAIALHNIENVKAVKNILDAGKKGFESRLIQREINSIGRKAYEGNTLTDTDVQRLKDLRLAQMEMVRHAPEFLEDPFKAISYGTIEQGAMMAEQGVKANLIAIPAATLVGGGTAIATKNPALAGAAFKSAYGSMMKIGYGVEMFKDTVGNYYLDYKEYTDKDGKQLLTDNEARLAATLAAAGEAYLEVANWDTVIGMLKGSAVEGEAKEVLAGIVANAADKASFKAQLAYYMKNRFGKAVKAGWSEIQEEGEQSVYTDLVHNAFAFYKPNGDLKKIGAEEMAANAWDNMWGAVPSVVGMTGAGHIASSSKYVNKIADWLTSKHEDVLTAQKTAGGISMVEQLIEDAKNSELAKNSRDVYDQLVTNSLEGTQYENVIVDTELLLNNDQDGEGNKIFYQLATAAGKSEQQADELKGSPLKIRVADYLKVVEDEKVREKLRTLISFDERDNCFKRIQEDAKEFRKKFDKRVDEQYSRIADRITNWVAANIEGEQEQAIMTQVLFEYMDPKEGVKEIRKQYQAQVDEYINPIVEQMRSGMKQGVTLYMTDDDGNIIPNGQGTDAHIGGAVRISNNDAWYSKYYKENKKAPSEKEMKQIARDALLGDNHYGVVTGFEGADPADLMELEEQMRSMFDNYDSVMASLDKLDKVVDNLDVSELNAMDGLSKEGVEAYKAAKEFLLKGNDKVRASAAASAILVAHYADVWAGNMRQTGHNVTAMDYVNKRLGWGDGNIGAGGLNQQRSVYNYTYEENQQAIKEWIKNCQIDDLPSVELPGVGDEFKELSKVEVKDWAIDKVGDLVGKSLTDPVGEKIYFEPETVNGIKESVEEYAHHMIAGKGHFKNDEVISKGRAVGLKLILDTINNPTAIIWEGDRTDQKTGEIKYGKRLYLSLYEDEANILGQVIVSIDVTDKGRVITSFVSKDGKGNKNKAFKDFKSKILNAQEIYYFTGRPSRHLRQPTEQRASTADASLHSSGNFILPQNYDVVKRKRAHYTTIQEKNQGENSEAYMQRAWHGTPHVFETFDLGAIGTGEGAQAHGWGLYFAQDKKVAENYRKVLTKGGIEGASYKFSINGRNYTRPVTGKIIADDGQELEPGLKVLNAMGYHDYVGTTSPFRGKGVRATVDEIIEALQHDFDNGYRSGEKYSAQDRQNIKNSLTTAKHEATEAEVDTIWNIYVKNAVIAEDVAWEVEKENKDKAEEEIKKLLGDRRGNAFIKKMEKANSRTISVIGHIEAFENRKIAMEYLKGLKDAQLSDYTYKEPGSLFEVDVPEDEELLNEQLKYDKQPDKVKEALKQFAEENSVDFSDMIGRQMYRTMSKMLGGDKAASYWLREHSVSGIIYMGLKDGKCFVVFDDKAVGTIERYNQAAGRSAETANIPMLEKAMELYNNTGDKNRVYEETGWYMGMDGKWRFEIPDNLDKINVNAFPGKNEEVSLWQIYDNPVLYAAYPWLADVKVYGEELEENTHGQADGESITLNVNRLYPKGRHEFITTFGGKRYYWSKAGITVEDEFRKEMPGEYNIAFKYIDEAKASGEPYPSVLERIDMLLQTIDNNLAEAKKKNNIFAINNWEHAQELYGNARALIESTYGDFESFDYYMEEDLDKKRVEVGKTLIHEIQHLIQREEDFAMGGNPKQVQQQINRQMSKTRDAMEKINKHGWDFYLVYEKYVNSYLSGDMEVVNKAKENYDWFKSFYGVTDEQENKILKLAGEYSRLHDQWMSKDSDFDKYQNLHGEQEARLASRKAELTTQLEAMRESYEKGYEGIYEEWAKTVPEEFKEKGKRLTELRETIDTADENFELSDEMYEEYESLVEIDELKDLEEELQEHELLRIRYEGLQQDYQELVTQGIDEFKAIVVFGGNVVAGSALNQQAARVQGATEITAAGQHIIHIMETADQSTFMHEMAHVFYDDLHDLAMDDNAPEQVKKDWQNLEKWTAWKEGQLEEYKGTATYDEFKELDAAIRAAQETGKAMYNGEECSLQSLLNRWAQERFARGFEEYLHSGKAPTKPLRNAFSKFKMWLTKIYRAVTGAGAKPSEQVRKIMDRMIATQDEIDSAMEEAQLDALEKKGLFKYLNGTSQEMWKKNLEELREDVAAKVMKIAMQDMTDKAKADRAEQLKAEREAAYERISQEPVFVVEQYLRQNSNLSVSAAVETLTDMTVEEYANELKARGGSLEAAVDQYMQEYEAQLKGPSRKEIKAAAQEAIANSHYTKLAMVFEIQALEKFVLDEESLVRKLKGIKDEEKAEREAAPKAERLINYVQKKQGKEHRIYRDALEGYIQKINEYAKQKMAGMEIKEATNPAMWKKLAADNADDSIESFAKVEYGMATKQRRIAYFYHTMAELAEKNRKEVDAKVKTLMGHARTMVKEKNMPANDRYLYNHLMYCFGLSNKDALKPPGYPESWKDILTNYGENLELSYVDQDGNIDLPDWLTSAMGADPEAGRYKDGYVSLRMDQLQLLYNVLENIYKCGREANKLKTVHDAQGNTLTVDEVVGEIVGNAINKIPALEVKDTTGAESETWWEAKKRRANEAYVSLLKPETILRQLGDSAVKYLYNPIKVAADNEMIETEKLAEKIRGVTDAYYDSLVEMYRNQDVANPEAEAKKAMKELRSKKQYKLGTSNLTKENLIAVALNWGTDLNRRRVMDGFQVSQGQVEKLLSNLNSADWQMIINIWSLFDDYWPRLVEVEARCSGAVLEKQEAMPFSIMDNTGFVYNLNGGYYPIKYDRHKNMKVGDRASDDVKRMNMSGVTRLGMGLGNTKERMETVKYKLRLDFGVFHESLGDTIHNICMREAVRDVNKVIRDNTFSEFMQATYGQATTRMLQNWVLDCWMKEPRQKDPWEQAAQWVREKQTIATLGFRTSTALLNFCNISYVIDYLGPTRTMAALKAFYARPSVQFDFALEKSVFLRERAETMDRDMGSILKRNKEKFGEDMYDALTAKAFYFISRTDLMLACPMWLSEYQRVYQESMDKNLTAEHAEREAVLAGDAAVRRVFGSGQMQDLASVQKGSEFTKIFTMYYSFFSVVHNALMMKVFEARQAYRKSAKPVFNTDGTIKGMERDYKDAAKALVPIAEGVILWMLVPAAMEACIRAYTGGDDKDKEAKNLAKKTFTTMAGTAVGGIPMLREFVPAVLEYAMGGRYFGMSGTPIGDMFDQVQRVMATVKSKKKTKLDVLRESLRTITPITGLPRTMTDGMVSAMQFIDHGKLTKDDILHYLWAIINDKNPDKKK